MKQYTIDGTIVETERVEVTRYGANKPRRTPTHPEFPYLCKTAIGYRVVYAQHRKHAFRKCEGMYGSCFGDPVLVT